MISLTQMSREAPSLLLDCQGLCRSRLPMLPKQLTQRMSSLRQSSLSFLVPNAVSLAKFASPIWHTLRIISAFVKMNFLALGDRSQRNASENQIGKIENTSRSTNFLFSLPMHKYQQEDIFYLINYKIS
ncbi:hypothetical protein FGO68_gene14486 [Halteria grandinella]|uniref:Uncharacterized protein n=1 Tax=Halteria grandinella TaxID=5974 RepID=A0A8J8NUC3_HALGN|nr:hypothetical protein FGO68_gene14486 [Halteria grandinella]